VQAPEARVHREVIRRPDGLDCNVGSCPAASPITLCWTNVGDPDDIELMQVWVIPRNDDVFGSWLEIQNR